MEALSVPYISKAEREAASRMTWRQILAHVTQAERCDENEARRQIGNAIQDRALTLRWAHERARWGAASPIYVPEDMPPRDAAFWLKCKISRRDHDAVLEPPPYDPTLVNKRRRKRLDKNRRFRKPLFLRAQVLRLWPLSRVATTAAARTQATAYLADLLKANGDMKRYDAWTACTERFPNLSERSFRYTVWPNSREKAGLDARARSGRKSTAS